MQSLTVPSESLQHIAPALSQPAESTVEISEVTEKRGTPTETEERLEVWNTHE